MTGILPRTVNDYFSWEFYESLPKSGNGTDIFFFGGNPIKYKVYTAWHTQLESIYPHTSRYRLMRAICERDINEVKAVVDKGFPLDQVQIEEKYGYNALGLAAALNRIGILEYLILRGSNVDNRDRNGNTALMHAVLNWQYDAIKYLVESGADIKLKDNYGFTALDKAKLRGLNSIVKYLEFQQRQDKTQHFPYFTIHFDFEERLADTSQNLYKKKKYYSLTPKVYPFNNLDGVYSATLLSFNQ